MSCDSCQRTLNLTLPKSLPPPLLPTPKGSNRTSGAPYRLNVTMARRHLLLCFDAFGTLFAPKLPIVEQYASAARESGLTDITAAQVQQTFKAAFTSQSK